MNSLLDRFKRIRAVMTACVEDSGLLSGRIVIPVGSELLLEDIEQLKEVGVVASVHAEGKLVNGPAMVGVEYALVVDMGHLTDYHETYDGLIRAAPVLAPVSYTVWASDDQREAGYRSSTALLQLLRGKGVAWADSTFFVAEAQVIEFPIEYAADDTLTLPAIHDSVVKFLDPRHLDADVRWNFFRKAVIRIFRDTPIYGRLGKLLRDMRAVYERANEDYSLYLDRYSFEEFLKNFESKRLEFISSLNQVLTSVQTALIAVPLGFFLIAEKFKVGAGLSFQNTVLLAGGLAFFALIFLLVVNQRKTLENVKRAMDDFEEDQKEKKTAKQARFVNLMVAANDQHGRVRRLLWGVQALLFVFSTLLVIGFVLACFGNGAEVVTESINTVLHFVLRISLPL